MKQAILRLLRKWYLQESGKERGSPSDWIKPEQIAFDPDLRQLTIKDLPPMVWTSAIPDTGSMDGMMDLGHHALLTDSFEANKLSVGDIVAFQVATRHVLHRIVEIGHDAEGWHCRTRGDNCIDTDPYILRPSHIKYLCLGVLY